jgi:hypothetical protein
MPKRAKNLDDQINKLSGELLRTRNLRSATLREQVKVLGIFSMTSREPKAGF